MTVAVDGVHGASGNVVLNWGSTTATSGSCATLPPVLFGSVSAPRVGDLLTATFGSWRPPGLFTGQWADCTEYECISIPDATGPAYRVGELDVGFSLRFLAFSTGDDGVEKVGISDPSGVAGRATTLRPNGRIYFASNRLNLDYDIWSMFGDGSSLQRVTTTAGFDSLPALSLNGDLLAWVKGSALWTAQANGNGPEPYRGQLHR